MRMASGLNVPMNTFDWCKKSRHKKQLKEVELHGGGVDRLLYLLLRVVDVNC